MEYTLLPTRRALVRCLCSYTSASPSQSRVGIPDQHLFLSTVLFCSYPCYVCTKQSLVVSQFLARISFGLFHSPLIGFAGLARLLLSSPARTPLSTVALD